MVFNCYLNNAIKLIIPWVMAIEEFWHLWDPFMKKYSCRKVQAERVGERDKQRERERERGRERGRERERGGERERDEENEG